jgi:hypothetical protein
MIDYSESPHIKYLLSPLAFVTIDRHNKGSSMSHVHQLGEVGADDYAAIEAAVMETPRGRWFLAEYVVCALQN